MVNGRSTAGAKINGAKSIFFERMVDGSWTASTDTADGEIAGNGATVLEARLALDEALRMASRKAQAPDANRLGHKRE